mgnify:CR=1 FL=1
MEQTEIRKVRASIHQQCGNRVKIQQDLGRNKVDIQEGVIQQAYPSVFTVLIDDELEPPYCGYAHWHITIVLMVTSIVTTLSYI